MEDFSLITAIAIALGLAAAGGFLARSLRLSPIVGYLAAGLIISPVTPGYRTDPAAIAQLANIGVIFLMFGVGLHFNLRDLMAVRTIAIPGAVIQVVAASAFGTGVGLAFGLPWREALVLGLAISIASTIILIRTLEDRGLLGTIHARVVIGWLIAQDIITVVALAILPTLGHADNGPIWQSVAFAVGRAAVFVAVMLVFGARLLPYLLSLVARTGSRELFVLAFVAAALGIAASAAAFGLSIALGAFIAGVAVSETETSHQVAADVVPLRDAFAVLFFVSVGMLLDPDIVRANKALFLAVLGSVLFVNAAIAFVVAAVFPFPGRTALVVGAGLAQLGEFTFIVGSEGLREGLMSDETYAIILAVAAISIVINPFAFSTLDAIESVLRRLGPVWRFVDRQGDIPEPDVPRSGHVVIVGYGRVGELTGHALAQLGIPFAVIEVNLERARALNEAGIPTIWGDAGTREVLERSSIEHARAVCITVPDESTAFVATATARALNPAVPILVRARTGGEIRPLRELGANEVVVPEYEGGLEIMRQALCVLGFDPQEALHLSNAVRDIHYQAEAHDHPI
ncbi:cation:proton antiporter [Tepidiforma flava]|uniref:Cation:proton antiporter n=1 Tax=Tepidiforma flava TaxID=3004094 RepID=A0ABY7M9Q2_9CHLR|nr:cation:proton antiporter [Tepidiforma flava]WBL36852.1 cation:proton antiporter [Tepidiforma flava]